MLANTSKVTSIHQALKPILAFKGVEKSFAEESGNVHAVRGVNLEIYPGEIFGLLGYSGAGKSTLLRMANLLTQPCKGEIIFQGKSLTKLAYKDLLHERQEIGMIFQEFNLFSQQSVLDNVAYPLILTGTSKKAARERAAELLDLVDLGDKKNSRPANLSGGQKQRVGIARALANRPSLLLSDEATSALDPQATEEILNLLVKLNKELGLSILLVTHQMEVAEKICDRIAFMETGKIKQVCTNQEFFSQRNSCFTRSIKEA